MFRNRLPIHVDCSGVIDIVSFGFRVGFKPVNAGINIVANAIVSPKFIINKFFAELASIFPRKIS